MVSAGKLLFAYSMATVYPLASQYWHQLPSSLKDGFPFSFLTKRYFSMKLHSSLKPLILSGLIACSVACSNDEPPVNASPSPVITARSVTKIALASTRTQSRRDSVITTISFSDADGDLGEDTRDTTRLKQVFGNQPWGNYQIRTFKLVNSTFEEVSTVAGTKQFVFLGNKPSRLPQNGTLAYNKVFVYKGNDKLIPVKFQIRMRDRNLNVSNVIETDTIHVPLAQ